MHHASAVMVVVVAVVMGVMAVMSHGDDASGSDNDPYKYR